MVESKDYNSMNQNFILDLVSALDYVGDLEAYLYKCETESSSCDIQYLKNKVADIKLDLNSMMNRLYDSRNNKT